jgi:hypothetical protein
MKSLCLILLLGLSMPGCSMFKKSGQQSRAYTKYLKQAKGSRDKQRHAIRQRAEMPSLRNPPPSPLQENVRTSEGE